MTASMRNKCKLSIYSFFMAFLFVGGLALAGSDFVGFPWGQLIGVPMLALFAWIGVVADKKYGSR